MRLEQPEIFLDRRCERMMTRDPAVLARVEFEKRKVDDPKHVPSAFRNPILLACQLQPQGTEQIQSGLRGTGHQEDCVSLLRTRLLNDGVHGGCTRILYDRSRIDAVVADLDPADAGATELFDKQRNVIQLLA